MIEFLLQASVSSSGLLAFSAPLTPFVMALSCPFFGTRNLLKYSTRLSGEPKGATLPM